MKNDEAKQQQQMKDNAHPKLSQGTMTIINAGSKKDIPTFETLYKAAKTIANKKLEQQEKRRKELEAEEMRDVTGKPLLFSRPKHLDQEAPKTKANAGYAEKHYKKTGK